MRYLWAVLLLPLAAAAQTGALVSGVLLDRDSPAVSGEFGVRATDNQVYRYRFDAQTQVDRAGAEASVAALEPGDKVEVVSDRMPHADIRYALAVHALSSRPARMPVTTRNRYGFGMDAGQNPVGDLFYSGVVFRLSSGSVALHMRDGADQTIVLLKNTRYVDGGEMVDAAALKPNMRVFVQAGKSLYDEVEAYQVVWGEILQPKQ